MNRVAAAALGLAAAAVALAAALPSGGRFGLGSGGGPGKVGDMPVAAVVRRDFVHRVPAEGNLRAARSTAVLVPATAQGGAFHIAWLAPDGSRVKAGDVVVRFDSTDIDKDLTDAQGDLATARLKSDKERGSDLAAIDRLARDAAAARLDLANARQFLKKDEMVFSRQDIIESEIDQDLAAAKEETARAQQQTRAAQDKASIGLLDVDIRQAELKIARARAAISALQVAAPHDGVLILKKDMTGDLPHIGDTVWSGMTLAEIPDLAAMEAEAFVLEADAGGLAVGRPARVTVESNPGAEYPAQISRVDAVPKPRLRGSPVQYFTVILRFARTDPNLMKPGQRVDAVLQLGERRGALVVPRQAVFQREGRNVVYRRRADGAGFEPVPVQLGPADLGMAVIESGLAAGDLVALRDPARATPLNGADGGAGAPGKPGTASSRSGAGTSGAAPALPAGVSSLP